MRMHAAWPNNFGEINCMKWGLISLDQGLAGLSSRDRYTDQLETKGENMQTCKTEPSAYELR